MQNQFLLPNLPSIFNASDIELVLMCRCINERSLMLNSFKVKKLMDLIKSTGLTQKDQTSLLHNLLNIGLIYSLSKEASKEYVDPNLDYFINAEKLIQALVNHFPKHVIGKYVLKFEHEDKILDGGFIENDNQIFSALMARLNAYNKVSKDNSPYLSGSVRVYQCIGLADGRDFFSRERAAAESLTHHQINSPEKIFYIPKYVILNKNSNNKWLANPSRICVCIG